MTEVKLYASKSKTILLFAISFIFLCLGIFILLVKQEKFSLGLGCAVLFGLITIIHLKELLSTKPRIIINENGITDYKNKQGEISWDVILEAEPLEMSQVKYVIIAVDKSFKTRPLKLKFLAKKYAKVDFKHIHLLLTNIKIKPETFAFFINEIISVGRDSRKIIINKYFTTA